ncbi:MAG: hypothetical protein RLN76_04050 [Phycisphaeraceae bacterium]
MRRASFSVIKKASSGSCVAAAAMGLVLAVTAPCRAVQKTWLGGAGSNGFWAAATDWSPTGVPAAADDILFNSIDTYVVNISEPDKPANSLTVSNGSVTWRNPRESPPDNRWST